MVPIISGIVVSLLELPVWPNKSLEELLSQGGRRCGEASFFSMAVSLSGPENNAQMI